MKFNIKKFEGTVNYVKRVLPSWKLFRKSHRRLRGVGYTRKNREESKKRRKMAYKSRKINRSRK